MDAADFSGALEHADAKDLLAMAKAAMEPRLDASSGWSNAATGFGTDRDKTTYTTFGGTILLTDQQLSNIYHGDDLAARMVDIIPDEMLRETPSIDVGDANVNALIADALTEIDFRKHFSDGARWGRLFGGGAVLIGADDGLPASTPLVPERAASVEYLYALDRRYLIPLTWYTTPGSRKLGQPETYMVTPASGHALGAAASVTAVHESRLLLFGGATTGIREREINLGWDLSVLQRAYDALRAFNTGWKAVEIMLTDGNQAVFTVRDLAKMIGANGSEVTKNRIMVMDLFRSVLKAIVLDAGSKDIPAEKFERQSVSFEQIPQTLDKFCLRLAATVPCPVTILFGQSPAGMNATGESDFRWHYDRIRSQQKIEIEPKLRRLVKIMLATKAMAGKVKADAPITIKFPPLWSETPLNEATRRKTIAESDKARIESQELLPEEVALTRAQPDGFDRDVVLTDEGKAAREAALDRKLTKLEEEPEPTPPPAIDPNMTEQEKLAQTRADAAEFIDLLRGYRRIVIAGGPRTGKGSLAVRASERYGIKLRHADALVGVKDWGDDSEEIARWLDEPGDQIIEGVSVPRALRKWLAANPERKLDATVCYLRNAIQVQNPGQRSMAKGCDTVWAEVKPELERRGVTVLERDSS